MGPVFADGEVNTGRIVMNFLAIAGGFLLGYVVTHLVLRLISKFTANKRLPALVERALRVIGGIIAAILVGLMVFGDGGWGFGGTGGANPGGEGGGEQKQLPEPRKEAKTPEKVVPAPKVDEPISGSELNVTVLSPAAFPNIFRFPMETEGLGLADAKKKLDAWKGSNRSELKNVYLMIYDDSTADGHPDLKGFQDYARHIGLIPDHKRINKPLSK
ncbi:MAG: hypothetical protein EXS09_16755 [Gemmataceae bacterium]|nr:hypothetical protein [Gemmataceae bacterium]